MSTAEPCCNWCKKKEGEDEAKLLKCSRCTVMYCGRDHQLKDWSSHKSWCKLASTYTSRKEALTMAAPKLPSYVADFHAWFNAVEVVVLVALRSALRLEEGSESLHRSHVLSVDLAPNPAFGDGKHDSERFIVESIDTMSFDSVHREWGVPKEELEMMKARTEVMRAEVEGRKDEEAFHDHLVTISAFNLVIKKEGKVLTQWKFKGFSPRKIYHEYASPTIPLQSRRLNPHWKHAFELGLELTPLKKPSLRELDMVDMMRSGDDELVTRIMKEMKRKKGRK